MKKQLIKIFLAITIIGFSIFGLTACQQKEAANEIKVGTIAGPGTQMMQLAKKIAKKQYGLDIKIVVFTDYTMPNTALANGSIDANMYQTVAYLNEEAKARGYKFAIVGKTFIYPMTIYSHKIKNIKDTPNKAIVAVPNDPSNEARALLLLQKAGLIKLKPGAGVFATTQDIISNPRNLQIKQLDAAQLPRVLNDVTLAVINANYAVSADLNTKKYGIYRESVEKPYTNVVVVRAKDKNNPKFKELVEALHNPKIVALAKKLYHGQAIPAWDVQN